MRRWTTYCVPIIAAAMLWLLPHPLEAAYLRNVPVKVVQPGGDTLRCFASGDEYYNWLHDAAGYTILCNPRTGYFEYATLVGGNIVPSGAIAGRADPAALGISKHLIAPPAVREGLRQSALARRRKPGSYPTAGSIQSLVVFIRFSDQPEFTKQISTYDGYFNSSSTSLKAYYQEASYGNLTITSTFYPPPSGGGVVSYQDSYPQSYFMPYNASTNPLGYTPAQQAGREDSLLLRAVSAIDSLVPGSLVIDSDGDGVIDGLCFIVRGGTTAWGTLLWPHAGVLGGGTIQGVSTGPYHFELEDFLASQGSSVLCHETFHTLGAPDLYHYSFDGMEPVGSWDLMAYNQSPPQHMGAYMKWRYGHWISSIPEITSNDTYSLSPLDATPDCCCMIPTSLSGTEYFVLEYRRNEGHFDASLPGQGLLVYRINTLADGEGDRSGPPDEVYIYRQGGTNTQDGDYTKAAFSAESGRMFLNSGTDPTPFFSDGSQSDLIIGNVGPAGSTISFTLGGPLPVTIASFTGGATSSGIVTLRWRTLSETNNYGFTVQRRAGSDTLFADVPGGFTPGHGTSTLPHDYAWSDSSHPPPPLRYRLRQSNLDGSYVLTDPIAVSLPAPRAVPEEFTLRANYPNPFNPSTTVEFSVKTTARATVTVRNALGQRVATLFDAVAEPGRLYTARFDGSGFASGVYYCTLRSSGETATRRMLLVR